MMATGDSQPLSRPHLHQPLRNSAQPRPHAQDAPSGPSRRDLTSWWKQFKRNAKKDEETVQPPSGIFGVPLNVSIKYANVAISLTGDDGQSFIYGYVPIVVAKCGVFLKEKATDVEGIFRLNGSAKRIKDLQEIFDSPDRYGKGLDWTGYTVHDAANILRRYLNQLPEPIVPLNFYERFRDPLRHYQEQDVGGKELHTNDVERFDHAKAVATYQSLIKELPSLNRQLLLYILDLLTVFASKSELNRMTAGNLAAIFQPGLLSHPSHDMAPLQYKLSQDVLIFLIENQDNFLMGMRGTAADEQTVKDVQRAVLPHPSPRPHIRRSASNASGGADSLRKYDNIQVSASSKHSRNSSANPASPATPNSLGGSNLGIHRSNTLPSKRTPGLSPNRFGQSPEPATPASGGLSPSIHSWRASRSPSQTPPLSATRIQNQPATDSTFSSNEIVGLGLPNFGIQSNKTSEGASASQDIGLAVSSTQRLLTPTKERKLGALFARSAPEIDRKESRQPNRLRKKRRIPGSASESAQSSTHSLQGGSDEPFVGPSLPHGTPGRRDGSINQSQTPTPKLSNTLATPTYQTTQASFGGSRAPPENVLKPNSPRTPSLHSRSSATDQSDLDQIEDTAKVEKGARRHNWRLHRASKRSPNHVQSSLSPPPFIGTNAGAGFSSSSVGSSNRPQKSFTNDSQLMGTETSGNEYPPSFALPSQESDLSSSAQMSSISNLKDSGEAERKSIFGKLKAKVAQVKEGVKEREAEKERAKTPPHSDGEKGSSRTSLSFFSAKEGRSGRGVSMDIPRDNRGIGSHELNPPTATPPTGPTPCSTSHPTPAPQLPPAIPEEMATTSREQPASGAPTQPTSGLPAV